MTGMEMRRMYAGGSSLREVASAAGVSSTTVRRWIRLTGGRMRDGTARVMRHDRGISRLQAPRVRASRAAEVRRLRAAGLSWRAIGREVGLSHEGARKATA